MADSVTVPKSLLEDILRILEHLDPRGGLDGPHFHRSGYSQRLEHDNALWELWMKIRQLQARIADTYLLTIDDVTEDEKRDLKIWLEAGNSVYDNPYTIYGENGCIMDFINGCRIGMEMAEWAEDINHDDWDDDPPF